MNTQKLNFLERRNLKKRKQPKVEVLPIVIPVPISGRRGSSRGRRGSKYDVLIESLSEYFLKKQQLKKDSLI